MTIQHITWSPSTCKCVIEQQLEDTDPAPNPTLLFFHYVCDKHLPLVSNKKQLNANQLKTKREQISNHRRKLLDDNRTRHLGEFDNHPIIKNRLETVKQLIQSLDTENLGLRMQAEAMGERTRQEKFLDGHEDDSMNKLLIGIHYPYAFISQVVYDQILKENTGGG